MARVLVVEPDRRIRKFIAGILAELGHHVEQCNDARDARRLLGRARFDVLASDLVLAERGAADLLALIPGLPLLTLRGERFRPGGDKRDKPSRLHTSPFRFEDLTTLVTAIAAAVPAARHGNPRGQQLHQPTANAA